VEKITVVGGTQLRGEVPVSGSKNGTLPLMAASLLIQGQTIIENVPDIMDVRTMMEMLRALGAKCSFVAPHTLHIDATDVNSVHAPYNLVNKMRGSFYVAGPLLARFGEAHVPLPGGCVIGSRPVNEHFEGFRALNAEVNLAFGEMHARARRLRGARIMLDPRHRSVGATINIMLAAVLAEGTTQLENASREPEVISCQQFLARAGADISGIGTTTVVIRGVKRLNDVRFTAIPDRMEAGTFLYATIVAGGDITVQKVQPQVMESVLDVVRRAGVEVALGNDYVRVCCSQRPLPVDVVTAPYPGFPTDLQPCHGVMCSLARGTSCIEETIFDARFNYADELRRMGADIKMVGHHAAIFRGVPRLTACPVEATDIRAAAALVLAGLAAEGCTEVNGAAFLDRGYESFELKLAGLGAQIRRVTDSNNSSSEQLCLA